MPPQENSPNSGPPAQSNNSEQVSATQPSPQLSPRMTNKQPSSSSHHSVRNILLIFLLVAVCSIVAFSIGKSGQKVVYRQPVPPPIALPPQAIVVAECVPGLGKQYVIPKDIPNGPIYDVVNSKVIAVEYNYKSVDLFLDPNRLSDTIIPFMKSYQIDHFTTSIGELKAATLAEAQSVPIHLTMYVVPDKVAKQIKCGNSKQG